LEFGEHSTKQPCNQQVSQSTWRATSLTRQLRLADSASDATNLATDVADLAGETSKPEEKKDLAFTFATAGRIAKIIRGLKSTEAMGIDNIPTSILNKGVVVLAGLISHLVNRSLAEGRVLKAFKVGKVFPVYKGKGKSR
jgi:hypothetical protein